MVFKLRTHCILLFLIISEQICFFYSVSFLHAQNNHLLIPNASFNLLLRAMIDDKLSNPITFVIKCGIIIMMLLNKIPNRKTQLILPKQYPIKAIETPLIATKANSTLAIIEMIDPWSINSGE